MNIRTEDEPAELLANPKWIRGTVDGIVIVNSRAVLGVWDNRHYPSWYFPVDDVSAELRPTGETTSRPGVGPATILDVVVGDHVLPGAATRHVDSPIVELRDRVRIDFDAVDRWFEEDVEVFSEPRNPYVRVDALASSRHVKVSSNGTVIAETHKPTLLFETGVATRFYIPPLDVQLDLLEPTEKTTSCPYKGIASYWSVTVDGTADENAAWSYPSPFPEAQAIAGMLCFYTNRFVVEVDGERVTT